MRNVSKHEFPTCGTAWALGSVSLDVLWEQPERFTARITFPFPELWWETHHAGLLALYHPFQIPFKMNELTLCSTFFREEW